MYLLTVLDSKTPKYCIKLSPQKKKFDANKKYQLRVRNHGNSYDL